MTGVDAYMLAVILFLALPVCVGVHCWAKYGMAAAVVLAAP